MNFVRRAATTVQYATLWTGERASTKESHRGLQQEDTWLPYSNCTKPNALVGTSLPQKISSQAQFGRHVAPLCDTGWRRVCIRTKRQNESIQQGISISPPQLGGNPCKVTCRPCKVNFHGREWGPQPCFQPCRLFQGGLTGLRKLRH